MGKKANNINLVKKGWNDFVSKNNYFFQLLQLVGGLVQNEEYAWRRRNNTLPQQEANGVIAKAKKEVAACLSSYKKYEGKTEDFLWSLLDDEDLINDETSAKFDNLVNTARNIKETALRQAGLSDGDSPSITKYSQIAANNMHGVNERVPFYFEAAIRLLSNLY